MEQEAFSSSKLFKETTATRKEASQVRALVITAYRTFSGSGALVDQKPTGAKSRVPDVPEYESIYLYNLQTAPTVTLMTAMSTDRNGVGGYV